MADSTDPHSPDAPATPYRVLARKYRPRSFDDLVGQEAMVRTLTNAFEANRIAQAWMLTGVRGVGKTTTARILARALNYETATVHQPTIRMIEPGVHDAAIMEGRHVDVVEMDAASHTGIDDIREIIAQVRYRPASARYKVYIIDEVHMLSTQAFNGLLKTLEEPPEHVKFVFATTEIRKVPITVLSRCQRFDLRRVEPGAMMAHLKRVLDAEGVAIDEDALRLLARASEGSVRDALSLADQAIAHGAGHVGAGTVRDMLGLADRARVVDLFEHLARGDGSAALRLFADSHAAGADPVVMLADLAEFTHLVTSLRFVPETAGDASLSPDEVERGRRFGEELSVRTLSEMWQMLLKAIEEARAAASPRQAAEMAIIRIAHAARLPSPEELIRLVQGGGPLPEPGPAPPVRTPPAVPAASRPTGEGAVAPTSPAVPPPAPRATEPVATRASPAPTLIGGGGGPTLAARMLAVHPDQTPRAAPLADPDGVASDAPASLRDLERLANEKRDSRMRAWVRRYMRLVRIEPGRIEIQLAGDAPPPTLANDLSRRLLDWTGSRWMVTVVGEGGGATLEEVDAERRRRLIAEAEADPEVAAILAAMPGASVAEVRLKGEPVDEPDEIASGEVAPDEETGEHALPERFDADDLGAGEGDADMDQGYVFDPDAGDEDD